MDKPGTVKLLAVDYAVIVSYLIFLIGLGLYYRRFAQANLENYFLGGRRMKGWMTGTSYAATCMNTDVAPADCGMTVISGLFVCWWYLSRFGLALMIGGLLVRVCVTQTPQHGFEPPHLMLQTRQGRSVLTVVTRQGMLTFCSLRNALFDNLNQLCISAQGGRNLNFDPRMGF